VRVANPLSCRIPGGSSGAQSACERGWAQVGWFPGRWRSVVATQATWSQPVAEVVVFSNEFARRRERPRRPWASSTRQRAGWGGKAGVVAGQVLLLAARRSSLVARRARRQTTTSRYDRSALGAKREAVDGLRLQTQSHPTGGRRRSLLRGILTNTEHRPFGPNRVQPGRRRSLCSGSRVRIQSVEIHVT
jgi:hypothetical protein